jgi:hypothetical protein
VKTLSLGELVVLVLLSTQSNVSRQHTFAGAYRVLPSSRYSKLQCPSSHFARSLATACFLLPVVSFLLRATTYVVDPNTDLARFFSLLLLRCHRSKKNDLTIQVAHTITLNCYQLIARYSVRVPSFVVLNSVY